MRRPVRLLLAIAAISAVSLPVAHAQFGGGFGGGSGSSSGGGFGNGVNSGGLPGLGFFGGNASAGGSGGQGAETNTANPGQPGNDSSDQATTTSDSTPAPTTAPSPTPSNEWDCPAGYTPWLDENGKWVTDDAGTPQCVPSSGLEDLDL